MNYLAGLLTPFQWAAIGVFVVLMLIINRQSFAALFTGWKWPASVTTTTTAPTPIENEDALDLAAFNRLTARYKRLKCPEGQKAMETAGQHFLHGAGGV